MAELHRGVRAQTVSVSVNTAAGAELFQIPGQGRLVGAYFSPTVAFAGGSTGTIALGKAGDDDYFATATSVHGSTNAVDFTILKRERQTRSVWVTITVGGDDTAGEGELIFEFISPFQ